MFSRCLFAALLLGILGCATRHEEIKAEAYTYTPPATLQVQSISATNSNYRVVRIEMKNVSEEPLWYSGEGCEYPHYAVQYKRSIGGWDGPTDTGVDCPMGSEWCRLDAGASIVFAIFLKPARARATPFRVGVTLTPSEYPTRATPEVIYWSEETTPE